jgi:hypothetical protein
MYSKKSGGSFERFLHISPREYEKIFTRLISQKSSRNLLPSFLLYIADRLMIWKNILYLILLAHLCLGHAETPENSKRYNLSICSLFKNESPFLKEWIEYHRLAGVDHFYLYNNGSFDRFREVLRPYISEGLVTLIYWPDLVSPFDKDPYLWPLSTQVTAYENAIKWSALNQTKWLVFLDVDEFLVPPASDSIIEVLDRYDEYPGIVISSDSFNAAKRGALPPRKLVIEALEIKAPVKRDLLRTVTKTIFKPDLCTHFIWPPYECQFQGNAEAIRIDRMELRINRYEDRMRFQRIEVISKPLHFEERYPTQGEISELLKMGYEVEDPERAIYRFIPTLYKNMGLY